MRLPLTFLLTGMLVTAGPAAADWKKHIIQPPAGGAINGTSTYDFDGDGQMDVIASFDRQVIVFQGPDWTPHTVHTFDPGVSRKKPGAACIHSCLMDADGDGDLDVLIAGHSSKNLVWFENPHSKAP
jgi:hypothetical protein